MSTATGTLAELEKDLNQAIMDGDALEAFDDFYAEDVVMQEGSDEPFIGKERNRRREQEFFSKVSEVRNLKVTDWAVGDGVTMSTWHFDITHEEWGEQTFDQVAVRHWRDGKVVKERFFKA